MDKMKEFSNKLHYLYKERPTDEFNIIGIIDLARQIWGESEWCPHVYVSDCHGIEMIKTPSGKEFAIGGTDIKDRILYDPWCGKPIKPLKPKQRIEPCPRYTGYITVEFVNKIDEIITVLNHHLNGDNV